METKYSITEPMIDAIPAEGRRNALLQRRLLERDQLTGGNHGSF
ncbi:MAG: hypothetical protein JWL59_1886 [Chthoniobacteraceae bacterium]|nr:hypothetical protein [Chthoniobacteraceae bacterium]